MAAKSANLYARIEPDVKEKAENILSTLGIPASSAINMFYKQIILQRGLPFEVKLPSSRPVDIHTLSETEFNEELEKGYSDMQAGRTKNAKKAIADIQTFSNMRSAALSSIESTSSKDVSVLIILFSSIRYSFFAFNIETFKYAPNFLFSSLSILFGIIAPLICNPVKLLQLAELFAICHNNNHFYN